MVLIETKTQQLSAVVNAYQPRWRHLLSMLTPTDFHGQTRTSTRSARAED